MPNASLLDVLGFVKLVLQSGFSESVKVCVNQCTILNAAFGHVSDFLEQVSGLGSRDKVAPVWDETLAVMHKARRLLDSCDTDNWIITTLLCEESRENFKDVYAELYGCIELVSVYLFQLASSEVQKSKISEAYSSCMLRRNSSSMLEDAAVSDRQQLMAMGLTAKMKGAGSLTDEDRALQMLCTILLEKSFSIDHRQLNLKEHLGHGAYGTVYEASWLGHNFALKVFNKGDTSFPRELAVLSSFKHPNILHIVGHSFDSQKEQYSLVMERMDMDLADFMKRCSNKGIQLPLLSSISIILQVANAMAWLHSKNVIHRDLKPQNVLIVQYGEDEGFSIRIADFGLARTDFITSLVSAATSRRGTKNFMAPEVWNSEHYSKKADVYSFAMLCYQVVTGGVMPFKDIMSKSDFMILVSRGVRPDLPVSCPSDIADLIQQCWSQDPKQRPSFPDICDRLKNIKARILTNSNLTAVRSKLLSSSGASAAPTFQAQSNKTVVDLESLVAATRNMSTGAGQGSSTQQFKEPTRTDTRSQRGELVKSNLLMMMQNGQVKEAFDKALSMNDPSTVWWLCSKVDPSLLLHFEQPLTLAEQINNNLGVDTQQKLEWLAGTIELVQNKINFQSPSPRLEKFLERLAQNIHGQLAVTPKDSDIAGSLIQMLTISNQLLQMLHNFKALNNYAHRRLF